MSCRFSHDDGAYVLGALSPTERLAFERHLDGCEECTRAVRELAGLPGLLGRVDVGALEHPPEDEPPPASLLPQLSRQVRRTGRRRTLVAAGLAAVLTAGLVVPVVAALAGGDDGRPTAAGSSPGAGVAAQPMAAVAGVPVRATLGFEPVSWGTRLWLTCTYQPDRSAYDPPPAVDYDLFVRTRDGRTEQVGSWRSLEGRTMRLTAATSASRTDIASVEVRTTDGRVVLRLTA